jgi:hypothetical protein
VEKVYISLGQLRVHILKKGLRLLPCFILKTKFGSKVLLGIIGSKVLLGITQQYVNGGKSLLPINQVVLQLAFFLHPFFLHHNGLQAIIFFLSVCLHALIEVVEERFNLRSFPSVSALIGRNIECAAYVFNRLGF